MTDRALQALALWVAANLALFGIWVAIILIGERRRRRRP